VWVAAENVSSFATRPFAQKLALAIHAIGQATWKDAIG
jgi:hypothetical protein